MWSEHCSYKSSKMSPADAADARATPCWSGPGQDAGAVDAGDGDAIVFKMESHSHPSAIEPYQGAATGVGGIVRDIVSMGARPVALLDPLMFGPLTDPRNRWLFEGVVAGIGGYGNCIGVPTVGGEIRFAEAHASNPCVNVMCLGFAKADELVTSQSLLPHVGSLMVLYGAATGRDGIGGVSVLASATLEDGAEASRPSVQIGDPFAEKLLIEASFAADRRGPAGGPAGPGRGGHHLCGQRVGGPRRDGRRRRPRRGPAARRRHGAVRDPDQRVPGTDARDRAPVQARGGRGGVQPVGIADGGDRDARRGRRAHDPAPRRGGRADAGRLVGRRGPRVRPSARRARPRRRARSRAHAVRR